MADNVDINITGEADSYDALMDKVIQDSMRLDAAIASNAAKVEKLANQYKNAQQSMEQFSRAQNGGNAYAQFNIDDILAGKNNYSVGSGTFKAPEFNWQENQDNGGAFADMLSGNKPINSTNIMSALTKSFGGLGAVVLPLVSIITTLSKSFERANKLGNEYNEILAQTEANYASFTESDMAASKSLSSLENAKSRYEAERGEFYSRGAQQNNIIKEGLYEIRTWFYEVQNDVADWLNGMGDESKELSYSADLIKFAAEKIEEAGATTKEAAELLMTGFTNNLVTMGFSTENAASIATSAVGAIAGYLSRPEIAMGDYDNIANAIYKSINTGSNASGAYGIQLSDDYLYGWLNKEKGFTGVASGMLNDRYEAAYRSEFALWQLDVLKNGGADELAKVNNEFINLGEILNSINGSLTSFDNLITVGNAKIYGSPDFVGGKVTNSKLELMIDDGTNRMTLQEFIEFAGGLENLNGEDIRTILKLYGADEWYKFLASVKDDDLRRKLLDLTEIEIKNIIANGTQEEVNALMKQLANVWDLLQQIDAFTPDMNDAIDQYIKNAQNNESKLMELFKPYTPKTSDELLFPIGTSDVMKKFSTAQHNMLMEGTLELKNPSNTSTPYQVAKGIASQTTNYNFHIGDVFGFNDFQSKVVEAVNKAQRASGSVSQIIDSPYRR